MGGKNKAKRWLLGRILKLDCEEFIPKFWSCNRKHWISSELQSSFGDPQEQLVR